MKAPQDIVLKPVITERSIDIMPNGKYTFRVAKDANKVEIAKAVEQLFSVEVIKVNTMNCTGRTRRMGRFEGKKADWKKAIVTINQNPDDKKTKSSIEFFDGLY
jgi:large subunit ribosomal protein L23